LGHFWYGGEAMRSSSGKTTVPSAGTGEVGVTGGHFAIQWAFPDSLFSPLPVDGSRAVVLGRDEGCEISLEGPEVSRSHAEIRREGPILTLKDLGSRNGSYVGGARVNECPLQEGDVLRIGDWIGVVVTAPSGASTSRDFGLIAPGLYGSGRLRDVLAPLERVAGSDLPVVVEGETGTGKEWTARAVHRWSGRKGAFLAVNCAALPEALVEAELFGYRKGAFTGADRASPGYFRAADGGTLLLDEIVDLPLAAQAKLLRVLEQKEVVSLGDPAPTPVDVRIVVAAQLSLQAAVKERRFRPDLYARIDGLTVTLPALRDRAEDVPGIFRAKLREHVASVPDLERRLVERLCLHDWPFNVRELDRLARRAALLHPGEPVLRLAHLQESLQPAGDAPGVTTAAAGPVAAPSKKEDRDAHDMTLLLEGLRRHRGNVARAAADAQISRQRAYRLMGARPDVNWREPDPTGSLS
jgi:transcriptional regulator with AAA-type ATPase domain